MHHFLWDASHEPQRKHRSLSTVTAQSPTEITNSQTFVHLVEFTKDILGKTFYHHSSTTLLPTLPLCLCLSASPRDWLRSLQYFPSVKTSSTPSFGLAEKGESGSPSTQNLTRNTFSTEFFQQRQFCPQIETWCWNRQTVKIIKCSLPVAFMLHFDSSTAAFSYHNPATITSQPATMHPLLSLLLLIRYKATYQPVWESGESKWFIVLGARLFFLVYCSAGD